jgi:putative DNA-invertase from lambdoid prophage Rac
MFGHCPKLTGFGKVTLVLSKSQSMTFRTARYIRTALSDGLKAMSRVFAYCRVSTTDQTTQNQLLEIQAAGFQIEPHRIVEESISGSVSAKERPGFVKLLDRLETGDVLIVTKLDRLGRNAMDVRTTVELLSSTGIRVHCLSLGGVDLTSPAGKMTMQVIAAVAEFKRDLLIERTQSGITSAKVASKRFVRLPALSTQEFETVLNRLVNGDNISELASEFKTSRQTIIRIMIKNCSVKLKDIILLGDQVNWA